MFLNFVFSLVLSFNVCATTGVIPVPGGTDENPCKEALTQLLENSSEESESILDQFLELGLDKATEVKRAVDAYFSVRNPLMGSNYYATYTEKFLAVYAVKVMEGNVTGATKLLDMSYTSLRDWTIDYERRTGTQIRNTKIYRIYSDEQKTETIELARKEGVSEAARQLNKPEETIRRWMEEFRVETSNYAKKDKVTKPVISLDVPNSSGQLNISRITIHEGVEERGVKIGDVYTEEFKAEIVQRAKEVGVTKATREFSVSKSSIRRWAKEIGATEAAKEFDVSDLSTIRRWLKNDRENNRN